LTDLSRRSSLVSCHSSDNFQKNLKNASPFFDFQSLFYIGEQLLPDVEFGLTKETSEDDRTSISKIFPKRWRLSATSFAASMAMAERVYAAPPTDPWDQAVQVLQTAFTGPIATGLALVAIVVGGLMFAFGEGAAKRTLAGVIFGVSMAVGAVNFMAWLFP